MKFKGSKLMTSILLVVLVTVFLVATIGARYFAIPLHLPPIAYAFMLLWLGGAILFACLSFREFVSCYLICTLCLLTGWRIAGMYDVWVISLPLLLAFICLFANFIFCAWDNMHSSTPLSLATWQLIFIRLYVGFDFVPHFTEKLFTGTGPRLIDMQDFISLHVPHPDLLVWLAGFCELGAAIALGLGILMRLGAWATALYLLIATWLGHHFFSGFIWAAGGWEYPVMWIILVLTFAITGFNTFTIEQEWKKRHSRQS